MISEIWYYGFVFQGNALPICHRQGIANSHRHSPRKERLASYSANALSRCSFWPRYRATQVEHRLNLGDRDPTVSHANIS
jgi:hypothetical protein